MADNAASPQNGSGALAPLSASTLAIMTIAVSMATFMEVLDMTIVNVSVPAISGSLAVSPNEGTWSISSYSLAAAIMQPLTGWLGRQFGEVRTYVVCILLFVLCSALCGLAVSLPMLVICRLLQGAVSGPMVPMAQAVMLRNFAPEKRGLAMGMWAMVVFTAPIFGPIIGGLITDNLSWPWIFYINVPLGLISAFTIWTILHKRDTKRVKIPIDVVGLTLLVAGVGALQYMLDNGNDNDWFNSPLILGAAVVAAICLTYLVAWEWTDKHPVIDLHLFQSRNFRVGVIGICLGFFGFFGATVVFPLWLQTTLGYTATWAGYATAPAGIIGLFLMPLIGSYMDRMNLRLVTSFAFIVFGFTMHWMADIDQTASFWQVVQPRFWQGLGLAFFFVPMNQILLSEIAPDQIAAAVGLSNFLRTICASTSTALSVWLWTHRGDYHHAVLAENIQGSPWSLFSEQLRSIGIAGNAAFGYVRELILGQSRTMAANDLYRIFGYMFWLLTPLVWFAKPPFRSAGGGGGH